PASHARIAPVIPGHPAPSPGWDPPAPAALFPAPPCARAVHGYNAGRSCAAARARAHRQPKGTAMPKRNDIQSILIIGAGPIIIGQACEFDYSGAQACKALREEGYRV